MPLKIGYITDVHYTATNTAIQKVNDFVADMEIEQPDFIIQGGDFLDRGWDGALWDPVAGAFESFSGEAYHVYGNHDYWEYYYSAQPNTRADYIAKIGKPNAYYSFDKNDYHIVVLDCAFNEAGTAYPNADRNAHIPSAQINWLKNDLANCGNKRVIVFAHWRLEPGKEDACIANHKYVRQVLEESGKVIACFSGHAHTSEHHEIGGIHYFSVAASTTGTYPIRPYAVIDITENPTGQNDSILLTAHDLGNSYNVTSTTFYNMRNSLSEPRRAILPMQNSLSFSATNDKIDFTDDWISSGDFTFSGYLRIKGNGGGSGGRIFDNGKFVFRVSTTSTLHIISNGGATVAQTPSIKPYFNKWVYVQFTRSSTGVVNFYLNGQPYGTINQASGTPEAGTDVMCIGNYTTGAKQFNGDLKNLLFFNRILTTAELQALYYNSILPADYASSCDCNLPLNEGSGLTATSISTDSRVGTITGATWSTNVPLKTRSTATNRVAVRDMGTSLSFDGVNDSVTATKISGIGSNQTLDVVFKLNRLGVAHTLINNSETTNLNLSGIAIASDNTISGAWYDGSYVGHTSSGKITDLDWHRATFTWDGTTPALYIDGVLQVGTTAPSLGGSTGFKIGVKTSAAVYLAGVIAEARVFNKALTSQEVSDLYLHNSVPQDGLVAEYLFDEATGTTAIDTSGNGNDGVISGCTYTTDVPLRPRTSV